MIQRNILIRSLTVVASSAFILGISEILLRVLAPVYTVGILRSYQYDAVIGMRVKPGIYMLETTDHQEEIRTNSLGTVNFQEDFKAYERLIFCLGDSFTEGTGLPADASYPFQLDLLLNRDADGVYHKRYGVVNLGLAGLGGEQSLLLLREYAGRLGKPFAVLYLGSDNDADDDRRFLSGARQGHLVDGNPHYGLFLRPLQWAGTTEIGKRMKLVLQRGQPPSPATSSVSVAEQEGPVLKRIAEQSRAYDARVVVSWIGTESYLWLQDWAQEHSVAFADWRPRAQSVALQIPALPQTNPHSGGHLRGWVMRTVAEAFAEQLR